MREGGWTRERMGRELFCFNFLRKQGYNGRNEERVHVFVSLLYEKVCESLRKSGWDERVNRNTAWERVSFSFSFSFFFLFSCYSEGIDAEQTHVHGDTYDQASSFLARRRDRMKLHPRLECWGITRREEERRRERGRRKKKEERRRQRKGRGRTFLKSFLAIYPRFTFYIFTTAGTIYRH